MENGRRPQSERGKFFSVYQRSREQRGAVAKVLGELDELNYRSRRDTSVVTCVVRGVPLKAQFDRVNGSLKIACWVNGERKKKVQNLFPFIPHFRAIRDLVVRSK